MNSRPLFIFEMANNHQGSLEHGLRIIREVHAVCEEFDFEFAFKLQYRDLDTFIHPAFASSQEHKFVKRFSETRLDKQAFRRLREEMSRYGFLAICTPFDEPSVDLIQEHRFDVIKIASCSFTDWPLLERIAQTRMPVIASTAGVGLEDIDKVVSFFVHRGISLSLMHCVAEYPTPAANLQLNQIDLLKARYPQHRIGYSTHEHPENLDAVKVAIAKGASIFEKHVGIATERAPLNAYSATPSQVARWLQSAREALQMCGTTAGRHAFSPGELADLRNLARGVFARRALAAGERLDMGSVFLAFPARDGQLLANDLSKYREYLLQKPVPAGDAILHDDVRSSDIRADIARIIAQVKQLLEDSNTVIPHSTVFELSHHYGLQDFQRTGATIINCVNREYCHKIIVLVPGQRHPVHYHKRKEETFRIVHGEVDITLDGVKKRYRPGDIVLIERGVRHGFESQGGAVFEEISTTHHADDSYYDDERITENRRRKTELTYWSND
ncbi:MAG: N-acetylneuraminate synthase family protein [Syntrophomonadaceae bacterium]|nr:N-acetylneuraminate synthase family protein [Syntrophomonadaceae bacterium]